MYYGFRYVEVSGVEEPPALADVRAKVLRADNERAGSIRTSDPTLNATYDMVRRAVESNMLSVLTDCPHREKLGWLEEYHLLYDTVAANFDVAAYYRKLVRDITDAQLADGMVPDIAPEYTVFGGGFRDDANWGGAVIMAPYKHWLAYGDDQPLRDAYPAMQRYMQYLATKASGDVLVARARRLGRVRHVDAARDPGDDGVLPLRRDHGRGGAARRRPDAAPGYAALAGRIQAAFNGRFLDAAGRQLRLRQPGEQRTAAGRGDRAGRAPRRRARSAARRHRRSAATTSRRARSACARCSTCSAPTATPRRCWRWRRTRRRRATPRCWRPAPRRCRSSGTAADPRTTS